MNRILQYIPGNSIIHRMNPLTKIFLTIAICASAFITDHPVYLVLLLAVDILIGLLAGIVNRTWSILRGLLKVAALLFVLPLFFLFRPAYSFSLISDKVRLND